MQYYLYDYIPDNFFRFLTGENRYIHSEIIFTLFLSFKENNSYTIEKDILLDMIEDYFNEKAFNEEYNDDGNILISSRDKATSIYRKLKDYGWIDDEYGPDQEIIVNLEDYTIQILNTLLELEKSNSFELSSKVYNIYTSLKNMDINRGYFILSTIVEDAKSLIDKLRSLNSNIKKYIKKIIKLENKDNNEYLRTILNQLLGEYKEKVIDEAYFYMKTKDNPRRYKRDFNSRLEKLSLDEEQKNILIYQIMENDNVSLLDASLRLEDILSYLSSVFDECLYLMDEIDKKNKIYISTSIDKINIILNDNKDIEGMLLHILKNFQETKLELDFPDRKYLNGASIYVNKVRRGVTQRSIVEDTKTIIDQETIKQFIRDKTKYSKQNVFLYVTSKLKEKEKLEIEDFNLQNQEEFIKLLLVIVYSVELDCNYEVEFFKDSVKKDGYKINRLEIRRKAV